MKNPVAKPAAKSHEFFDICEDEFEPTLRRALGLVCRLRGVHVDKGSDRDHGYAIIAMARVYGVSWEDDSATSLSTTEDVRMSAYVTICQNGNLLLVVGRRGLPTLCAELATEAHDHAAGLRKWGPVNAHAVLFLRDFAALPRSQWPKSSEELVEFMNARRETDKVH